MMTKQRTRTDFMALTISAGAGVAEQRQDGPGRNYRYTIGVQSDATGARIRFEYHDSVHAYEQGTDQLNREGLLFAFWAFVSDAAGVDGVSFADWADGVGLSTDSMSARSTYDACRRSLMKFRRLFHDAERFSPAFVLEQLAAEGIE